MSFVAFFYVSAALDPNPSRIAVKQAFDDGTLNYDIYRYLEAVPGFVVMESDNAGSCYMYGHMLAPQESLFGLGARSANTDIVNCEALQGVVQEADSPAVYISYYRYWQGAAAFSKVFLSFLSVQQYQLAISFALVLLCGMIAWIGWRRSPLIGLGFLATFAMTSDFLWQGFSPLHGVSSIVGLVGSLMVYVSFKRDWSTRWGWLIVAGMGYAIVAHTLIPMAFLLLTFMMAAIASPTSVEQSVSRRLVAPLGYPLLWLAGYGIGSASRWVWTVTLGPGLETLQEEFSYSSDKFITTSPIDPFYQLVGLLTKTWLEVGVMQVGLIVMGLIIGASIGSQMSATRRRSTLLINLAPLIYPLGWLSAFAFHTNHTYVHAVLAMMLMLVLFAFEQNRLAADDEVKVKTADRGSVN